LVVVVSSEGSARRAIDFLTSASSLRPRSDPKGVWGSSLGRRLAPSARPRCRA